MPRVKRALPEAAAKEAERIAKVIARAGLGSRREIEDWVTAGRVAVNGIVLNSPAFTVTPDDQIMVDGEPLPERERTRLFLYHKPTGVVTTNRDPEGRTTLFELLPTSLPRLVSVGRLDLTSEGLLLLTNDGGLARVLELPDTGWLRRYRVRAKGTVDQGQLDGLIRGITVEGIEYGPIEAVLDRVQGSNCWITVSLREGKNREVRNVLGALGLAVNRLIRVSYGPFQLGDIPEGGIEEVRTRILRDQLGDEIAAAASADFDGPLFEREPEEAPRPAPRAAVAATEDGRPARGARTEAGGRGVRRPSMREEDPERAVPASPRSRRQADTREVVTAGTVADRRGREIKVERKITPPGEERGPRRSRSDAADGDRGFDARRGGSFDGPARGRDDRNDGAKRSFRSEGAGERPRSGPGGRFSRDDAPRGNREDSPRAARDGEDRPKRAFRSEGAGERPRSGPGGGRFSRDDAPRGNREDRPRAPRAEGEDRPKRAFRSEGAGERPRSGPGGGRFSRDDAPRGDRFDAPRRGPPREAREERPRAARSEGDDRPKRSFRSEGAGERPRSGPAGGRFARDDAPRGDRFDAPRRGPPREAREERPRAARSEGEDRPKRAFRSEGAGERPRSGPGGGRFSRDDAPRGERFDAPRRGPPREGREDHRPRGLPEGVDRSDSSPWRDDAQSRPARARPARDEAGRGERPARFEKPAGARPARAPGGGGFRSERPERSERTERTPRPAGAKPMGRSGAKDVGFSGGDRSERPRSAGGKPGGFKAGGREGGPSKGGGFKSGPPRGKGGAPRAGKDGSARGGKPSGPRTRG